MPRSEAQRRADRAYEARRLASRARCTIAATMAREDADELRRLLALEGITINNWIVTAALAYIRDHAAALDGSTGAAPGDDPTAAPER